MKCGVTMMKASDEAGKTKCRKHVAKTGEELKEQVTSNPQNMTPKATDKSVP